MKARYPSMQRISGALSVAAVLATRLGCGLLSVPATAQDVSGVLSADLAIDLAAHENEVKIGRLHDGTVIESVVPTDIREPSQALACGADRDVFLLGLDAAQSNRLELFRWQGPGIGYAFEGSLALGTGSWSGLAWLDNAQGLLLLDNAGGRLAFLAFLPGGPLIGSPNDLIASGAWPSLADDRNRRLTVVDLAAGAWQAFAHVPESDLSLADTADTLVVERKPNGDLVTRIAERQYGRIAILQEGVVPVASTTVPVMGPKNTEVRILRLLSPDGPANLLGSATTDQSGRADVPISALQVADVLVADTPLLPWSPGMSPWTFAEHRIGTSDLLPNGVRLAVRPHQPGCEVGRRLFSIKLDLAHPQGAPLQTPVHYPDVTLVLGSGAHQIHSWNGRPVLVGDLYIGTDGSIEHPYRSGLARVRAPIPDDPILGGHEVWFQWIVVDQGTSFLSEIVGVEIQDPHFSELGATSGLRASGDGRRSERRARSRAMDWLRSHGARMLDREQRARLFPGLRSGR